MGVLNSEKICTVDNRQLLRKNRPTQLEMMWFRLMVFFQLICLEKVVLTQLIGNAKEQCQESNGTLLTKHVCQPGDYDRTEPPSAPTNVQAEIKLVDLSSLNENSMTVTMKLTMTVYWNETRLVPVGSWSQVQLMRAAHYSAMNRIWRPNFHINKLITLAGKVKRFN